LDEGQEGSKKFIPLQTRSNRAWSSRHGGHFGWTSLLRASFEDAELASEFDYYHLHLQDDQSDIMGDDLLMIRGLKHVIVVHISYSHS
jgi:hypothetical protein